MLFNKLDKNVMDVVGIVLQKNLLILVKIFWNVQIENVVKDIVKIVVMILHGIKIIVIVNKLMIVLIIPKNICYVHIVKMYFLTILIIGNIILLLNVKAVIGHRVLIVGILYQLVFFTVV